VLGMSEYEPRLVEVLSPLLMTTHSDQLGDNLKVVADWHNESLKTFRDMGDEGAVVKVLLDHYSRFSNPPKVIDLSIMITADYPFAFRVNPRRVGSILRGLGFEPRRGGGGNYIVPATEQQLEELALRYEIKWEPNRLV
ncbi:MAG: hypothetical protein R3293_28610, partial [Candidatus Promineifilaceae bacterium]|nr:hypothetical protein [Candidatus Promineifilaceae bacterium]